jgi:hypothetical protein
MLAKLVTSQSLHFVFEVTMSLALTIVETKRWPGVKMLASLYF